jgi:hypothetical protein
MRSDHQVQNVVEEEIEEIEIKEEEIEEIEIKKVVVQKEDGGGIGLEVDKRLEVGEKIEKNALEEVIEVGEDAQIIDTKKREKEEAKGIGHQVIKNQNAD